MASLTLEWLHIIVLLGAVQGVFLAGALATKRRNRTANRLLAATMLAFSIGLASTVYHAGYVEVLPHFFGWAARACLDGKPQHTYHPSRAAISPT